MPAARDPFEHPALSESVRELARRGELRSYRRGTLLIQEGDRGDTIYIILSGRLRAFSAQPETGKEVHFGTYGPGEYVGEMGLDGGPRSASVIALEATQCAMIVRPRLEAYLNDRPQFAFELLAKVIRRARDATLSTKRMALNDVYGRIKLLLESMEPEPWEGEGVCLGRMTQRDIAARVGCTPKMVSRVMKDLEQGDYLHLEPAGLVVLKDLPARW